ncbi:MAG TPA: hypothetical protein VL361_05890, partial [Candidatus Limnocylindrales bacterium]|nr:hypothetical protein [Candidatus Limnocylindrales bacterium]
WTEVHGHHRDVATRRIFFGALVVRGLKSTATIGMSLRDAIFRGALVRGLKSTASVGMSLRDGATAGGFEGRWRLASESADGPFHASGWPCGTNEKVNA